MALKTVLIAQKMLTFGPKSHLMLRFNPRMTPCGVFKLLIVLTIGLLASNLSAQEAPDSVTLPQADSLSERLNHELLEQLRLRVSNMDPIRVADSVRKEQLIVRLSELETTDNLEKEKIKAELDSIKKEAQERMATRQKQIDSLRTYVVGAPVIGVMKDTIFNIYLRIGSYSAEARSQKIRERILKMYHDDFSEKDTIYISMSDDYADLMYRDLILMTVTDDDALMEGMSILSLATMHRDAITKSLLYAHEETSTKVILTRIGLMVAGIIVLGLLIWGLNRVFRYLRDRISKRDNWFKDLKYKDNVILTVDQEKDLVGKLLMGIKWIIVAVVFFLIIPHLFSLFPNTRMWSRQIFDTIWEPINNLALRVWNYLPNLLNIAIIVIVIRAFLKLCKYFFKGIKNGRFEIRGFHPAFATPSYQLLRMLLLVFCLILIFPYLPGAGSAAFNGISVFVGILVSFGSSSAIANMIAGIVITYMRPFKIGDRVKMDDITGDVLEKTLLVTRIKQVTNEVVTIPNSKILNSSTINFSSLAETKGLILSVPVTMGYDIPRKKAEEVMLRAISRCKGIMEDPKPFVLQSKHEDNYIVYLLNGYTTEANGQAGIYSDILDMLYDEFTEEGIELVSPNYIAVRDGNEKTVPPEGRPCDRSEKPEDDEGKKNKDEEPQEEMINGEMVPIDKSKKKKDPLEDEEEDEPKQEDPEEEMINGEMVPIEEKNKKSDPLEDEEDKKDDAPEDPDNEAEKENLKEKLRQDRAKAKEKEKEAKQILDEAREKDLAKRRKEAKAEREDEEMKEKEEQESSEDSSEDRR